MPTPLQFNFTAMNDFTHYFSASFSGTARRSPASRRAVAGCRKPRSATSTGTRPARLVELGAGTGPITQVIARSAAAGLPRRRRRTRPRFRPLAPRAFSASGPTSISSKATFATWRRSLLADRGVDRVDHVVSGLPVPSFPRAIATGAVSGRRQGLACAMGLLIKSPRFPGFTGGFTAGTSMTCDSRSSRATCRRPGRIFAGDGRAESLAQGALDSHPPCGEGLGSGASSLRKPRTPCRLALGSHVSQPRLSPPCPAAVRGARSRRLRSQSRAGRFAGWCKRPASTRFGRDHRFPFDSLGGRLSAGGPDPNVRGALGRVPASRLSRLRQPDLAGPHSVPRPDQRDDRRGDQVHPGLGRDGRVQSQGRPDALGFLPGLPAGIAAVSWQDLFSGRIDRPRTSRRRAFSRAT